jgi:hypothetical protein
MASHGQTTCEDLHKIEYCMCVLRGTNLTAKPQHAKERNSRGAPTRRTGIPGDDRTDARAAHRHVIDSFIGGRWSARSEDGVGTDVLLVGGWGADEIRPLRLTSGSPSRQATRTGTVVRYCAGHAQYYWCRPCCPNFFPKPDRLSSSAKPTTTEEPS